MTKLKTLQEVSSLSRNWAFTRTSASDLRLKETRPQRDELCSKMLELVKPFKRCGLDNPIWVSDLMTTIEFLSVANRYAEFEEQYELLLSELKQNIRQAKLERKSK